MSTKLTPKSFSISFAEVALLTGPALNDLDFGTSVENSPILMDPMLLTRLPKEDVAGRLVGEMAMSFGPDKTYFLPIGPHWRLFERDVGERKPRPCIPKSQIEAERGCWNVLELEVPLLETLSIKLVGVNVEALGDSLDPSPELCVFELKFGTERNGS